MTLRTQKFHPGDRALWDDHVEVTVLRAQPMPGGGWRYTIKAVNTDYEEPGVTERRLRRLNP